MMIRRVICGDDVAFVGGSVDGRRRASRSCMYLGSSSRVTYYLERDAIVDAQFVLSSVTFVMASPM